MFDISPIQILIVLVIALLVFGPKRLPEMARGLGRGIRDFKNSVESAGREDDDAPPRPAAPAAAAAPATAATTAPPAEAPAADDLDGVVVPGTRPGP